MHRRRGRALSVALDHLVVAAATLEQGAAWCEAVLGVVPAPGGRHALMGTHNRLLKIASKNFPDSYLEIIAIDPQAAPPTRARWFGLDAPELQASLAAAPRLIHAVARSTLLDMHRWGLIVAGCRPGEPLQASRQTAEGLLSWRILVAQDGRLDCDGALPTLIQWQGAHPAPRLPDSGLGLRALQLCGVPRAAREVLRLRGVSVQSTPGPALRATLDTPKGAVTLESGG